MEYQESLMRVLKYPADETELRRKCEPVSPNDIEQISNVVLPRMLQVLTEELGMGLSAPQVGIPLRFFLIKVPNCRPVYCLNPKIIKKSGMVTFTESCLSFPDTIGRVQRYSKLRATWLNRYGTRQVLDLDGLFSICFQHELDHLDGILFIDKAKDHISKPSIPKTKLIYTPIVAAEGSEIVPRSDISIEVK
jgi:peptide deformylase